MAMHSGFSVRLEGVEFSWDSKTRWRFEDLHLDLASLNRRLPIVGRTGSGKSTLLYVIAAMKWPTSGRITWQLPSGETQSWIAETDSSEQIRAWNALRSRHFGFAFQDGTLLPFLTVGENLQYPLIRAGVSRRKAGQRARQQLSDVLLDHEKTEIEDILRKFPRTLSGGQRQRAALAQAMVRDPLVLFADEPTGNLDLKTQREVMQCVMSWLEGLSDRAFVWVTHHEDDAAIYGARRSLEVFHPKSGAETAYHWIEVDKRRRSPIGFSSSPGMAG
jgi:ABC-type lipoprotein export system ATPase subunit